MYAWHPGVAGAVLAPPLSVPGQRTYCQRRANLPSRAARGLANHQDPVTTSHLLGGKPESIPKDRGPVKEIDVTVDNKQIIRQAGKSPRAKTRGWVAACTETARLAG